MTPPDETRGSLDVIEERDGPDDDRTWRRLAAAFYLKPSGITGIVHDWIASGEDADDEVDQDVKEMAKYMAEHCRKLYASRLTPLQRELAAAERIAEERRERAKQAESDLSRFKVALANVSGALCDAGDVIVPADECRYGEAVRKLTAERDEARRERDEGRRWRIDAKREAAQYKLDFEGELAGNAELREVHGALDEETMGMFVARMKRERDAARARVKELELENACVSCAERIARIAELDGALLRARTSLVIMRCGAKGRDADGLDMSVTDIDAALTPSAAKPEETPPCASCGGTDHRACNLTPAAKCGTCGDRRWVCSAIGRPCGRIDLCAPQPGCAIPCPSCAAPAAGEQRWGVAFVGYSDSDQVAPERGVIVASEPASFTTQAEARVLAGQFTAESAARHPGTHSVFRALPLPPAAKGAK